MGQEVVAAASHEHIPSAKDHEREDECNQCRNATDNTELHLVATCDALFIDSKEGPRLAFGAEDTHVIWRTISPVGWLCVVGKVSTTALVRVTRADHRRVQ
jgi:hypothetical protein